VLDVRAARHAEIARRYETKSEREPVSIAVLRIAELRRLLLSRYGTVLPDDDAGRDDALIMAHHLAKRPEARRNIGLWLGLWAPWMSATEADAFIGRVLAKPLRWRADKLAMRLNLNQVERQRLRIVTIGACDVLKAERTARRKAKARQRDEARRRTAGAKTRSEYEACSLSRNKPWEAVSMSRASWYRAGKPEP
jgi:hypothetical protein